MFSETKLFFGIIATLLTLAGFFPYIRDIWKGETKPHMYTWLIWAITQGIATVALWQGGGGWGTLNLCAALTFVVSVFLLSLKYGWPDISRSDKIILAVAFLAIVGWWFFNSPTLAVVMASAIDGIGYLPTIRKTYIDPWSETLTFWACMFLGAGFGLLAITNYSLQTVLYLATIGSLEVFLFALCIVRRRFVLKPAH